MNNNQPNPDHVLTLFEANPEELFAEIIRLREQLDRSSQYIDALIDNNSQIIDQLREAQCMAWLWKRAAKENFRIKRMVADYAKRLKTNEESE